MKEKGPGRPAASGSRSLAEASFFLFIVIITLRLHKYPFLLAVWWRNVVL